MNIKMMYGSIFTSKAAVLVAPVNSIGVMGKGLALVLKETFPYESQIFNSHSINKRKLDGDELIDPYLIARRDDESRYLLMFPTKIHWKNPSKLEYLETGLPKAIEKLNALAIKSCAWPLLGTGLGGLSEDDVLPLMLEHLKNFNGQTEIWKYEE